MKGESYKKRVASNVKYHKEIMEDEKRPLWLAIEKSPLSFHCLSSISVSTEWWEQQANWKCSRASEWKEIDTKVDCFFFFFPFSNSFTFTDDPCLNW